MFLGVYKTISVKALFYTVVLGVVLFVPKFSQAANLYQQTTKNVSSDTLDSAVCLTAGLCSQTLGTGLSGTVYKIIFSAKRTGVGGNPFYKVGLRCFDDSGYSTYNSSCSGYDNTGVSISSESQIDYERELSTPLVLQSGKYYLIDWDCASTCGGADINIYGASANSYANGVFYKNRPTTDGSIADSYFKVQDNQPSTTAAGVYITSPANGSTIGYLDKFVVTANTDNPYNSFFDDREIRVDYGFSSGVYEYAGIYNHFWTTASVSVDVEVNHFDIPTGSTIYAKAKYFIHGQLQYTSTEVSFTINNSLGGLASASAYDFWGTNPRPMFTTASASQNLNVCASKTTTYCNGLFSMASQSFLSPTGLATGLGNGLCKALACLVIPHETVVENTIHELARTRNVFPFNWAISAFQIVESLFVYNSTSYDEYSDLTFNNLDLDSYGTSHSFNVPIYNTASVSEFIPQSSITFIRTMFVAVIWLSAVFAWYFMLIKRV